MKKFTFASLFLLVIASSGFAQTKQARNPLGHGQEFGGIRTFLRAPYVDDIEKVNADIVVMGVPFDEGTTARPGARYGPRDIREGSLIYAGTNGFFYIDGER